MAWLTGWNKRKAKIINGTTAGTQTNYQMKFITHRESGTDTLTDVYLGTSVRDDFGDIRFTTSDGSTLLSYWIESYTSTVATIWVEIDYIPINPGSVVIYLYYSNPSSTTTSSISDTFIFGDDFVNLNNWTISTSNGAMTASVASNILTETFSGVGSGYVYRNVGLGATNHITEFEMYDNAISRTLVNWGAFSEAPAVGNDLHTGIKQ